MPSRAADVQFCLLRHDFHIYEFNLFMSGATHADASLQIAETGQLVTGVMILFNGLLFLGFYTVGFPQRFYVFISKW